jgi:hypothetical protein
VPEVDALYGTALKMYTPFRSNPRIFFALVSTTVASSEATTLLRPQGTAAGCGLDGAAVADDTSRFFGTRAEAVTPAHDAAMPASRVRLPLGERNRIFGYLGMRLLLELSCPFILLSHEFILSLNK